CTGGWNTMDYW
nr:immunoglobulin heavy chain junction region [Mus musculus]